MSLPLRCATSLAASLLLLPLAGACRRPAAPARDALWKEFSGARAFAQVERIAKFGARPSGSPALEQERVYLEEQLRATGWAVERQTFTASTPNGLVTFANLIARRPDAAPADPRALVCTHYDTKWFAGVEFVGANDGGSGTGALLELARVLAGDPAFARRLELVFFDGEEAVREFTETDGLYGSRHFAHALVAGERARQFKAGVVWDMMGDRDLDITLPPSSPANLARGIFAAAEALGTRAHFGYARGDILDDHVPLNNAGIPTIDLIDFDFPAWHTPADTLDKISAASLETVGQATLYMLGKAAPEWK